MEDFKAALVLFHDIGTELTVAILEDIDLNFAEVTLMIFEDLPLRELPVFLPRELLFSQPK